MMKLTKDFEELFACFNHNDVRALIVGGYAVAYYAKPRYTKDIDLFIEPSEENATRILKALQEFGFGNIGLAQSDITKIGQIIQLGFAPNRVDLITEIPEVSFNEAWQTRVPGRYGKQVVHYINKDLLIRSKRAAGRPQDQIDVNWLTECGDDL